MQRLVDRPQEAGAHARAPGARSAPSAPRREAHASHHHPGGARRPLLVYAATRVVVLLTAVVASLVVSHDLGRGPWPHLGGPHLGFLRALARWDGAWYLEVAQHGYRVVHAPPGGHASLAFFPLYPLLVRVVSTVTQAPVLVSGIILATLLGGAATWLVWKLASEFAPRDVAERAAILFAVFPGSFVLSMAYSEALMVAAAAACLLFLGRRRWWLAGLAGAVATATRPNALGVVVACAVAAGFAIARRREWRSLVAVAIAPLGELGFFAYLWVARGTPWAWLDVERKVWVDHVDFGSGLVDRVQLWLQHPSLGMDPGRLNPFVGVLGIVAALVGVWWLLRAWYLRRLPPEVAVFALAELALAITSYDIGLRPRLLLAAFPIAIAAAYALRGRWYQIVAWSSTVVLVVLAWVTFVSLAATP